MSTMLLSVEPNTFKQIKSGKKIFAYRKPSYTETTGAYLYISNPVQKIVGYIEFDEKIELKEWKEKYKDNEEISKRIDDYISRNYRYAMPINKFQMTTEISLKDLRKDLERFIIPESYYYLDDYAELKEYIENNIKYTDEVVENNFETVTDENICK